MQNLKQCFRLFLSAWLLLALPASAGEPPPQAGAGAGRIELQAIVGYAGFVDDAFIDLHHSAFGGAARIYLTERFSLQPELVYMYHSPGDKDWVLIPALAADLRPREKRLVPYVIGGVGFLYHQGGIFSGTTLTGGVGLGTKIFLSERWYLAPEVRVGWEPFLRATVGIGYVLRH